MSIKENDCIKLFGDAEELVTYKNGGGPYYALTKRILDRYLFLQLSIKFRQDAGMLVGDPEDLEFMVVKEIGETLERMKASDVPALVKQEMVLHASYCSAEMSNLTEYEKAEKLGMSQSMYFRLKRTGIRNVAWLLFINKELP